MNYTSSFCILNFLFDVPFPDFLFLRLFPPSLSLYPIKNLLTFYPFVFLPEKENRISLPFSPLLFFSCSSSPILPKPPSFFSPLCFAITISLHPFPFSLSFYFVFLYNISPLIRIPCLVFFFFKFILSSSSTISCLFVPYLFYINKEKLID